MNINTKNSRNPTSPPAKFTLTSQTNSSAMSIKISTAPAEAELGGAGGWKRKEIKTGQTVFKLFGLLPH